MPTKVNHLIVTWPGRVGFDIDLAIVQWTELKSDEGKRLYRVTMSSPAGRHIDETIHEAHILDWRDNERAKQRARAFASRMGYLAEAA